MAPASERRFVDHAAGVYVSDLFSGRVDDFEDPGSVAVQWVEVLPAVPHLEVWEEQAAALGKRGGLPIMGSDAWKDGRNRFPLAASPSFWLGFVLHLLRMPGRDDDRHAELVIASGAGV